MNPEVRFRVPQHVLERANEMAAQYGLAASKGKTGGAAQLARGALYTALGLALPHDLHQLQKETFADVRQVHQEYTRGRPHLRVEVHHRIHPSYRKDKVLKEGRPVAARTTTILEFEQGELPDFLIPYVALFEDGLPWVTLNLEGRISPRPRALGELVSLNERCTIEELAACLAQIKTERAERERRAEEHANRSARGEAILRKWVPQHGSELLKNRLAGDYSWLDLAEEEYALRVLRDIGIEEAISLSSFSFLGRDAKTPQIRAQVEPTLATMKRLKTLSAIGPDVGVYAMAITFENDQGQSVEAVRLRVETPMPGRRSFLLDQTCILDSKKRFRREEGSHHHGL